jgi:geranylgeranyl diphosphate synthase type 3
MLFQNLLQSLSHILQVPGKIRARFSHAYNYWLKVPADKLIVVKEIAHMLHYSILLYYGYRYYLLLMQIYHF